MEGELNHPGGRPPRGPPQPPAGERQDTPFLLAPASPAGRAPAEEQGGEGDPPHRCRRKGRPPPRAPTKGLLSPAPTTHPPRPGPAHRALPSPPLPSPAPPSPSLSAHKEPEGPPFPRGLRPKMEAGAPHTHPGGKGAVWGCCSAGCQGARQPRREG